MSKTVEKSSNVTAKITIRLSNMNVTGDLY